MTIVLKFYGVIVQLIKVYRVLIGSFVTEKLKLNKRLIIKGVPNLKLDNALSDSLKAREFEFGFSLFIPCIT